MILVAHSGPDSANALDWAAREAVRQGDSLTIMHVIAVSGITGDFPELPEEITEAADELLAAAAERARELGVTEVETAKGYRSITAALVEMSREAELVVVGNRGHGEASSAVLGSVAYAVTSHASCPVVVVRGDGHTDIAPGHRVVVGIDGSRSGVHAGFFAAEFAQRAGAELEVVGVWDTATLGTVSSEFAARVGIVGLKDKHETQMHKWVDLAVAKLAERFPGLKVTGSVEQGSPVVVLREKSENAGLLVVGTRGRGGFAGLLLGSVSHRLIHDIGCPIAVVR